MGFDAHVGLHAQQTQALLNRFRKYRGSHIATKVFSIAGLVNHHGHHNAWVVDRCDTHEEAAVFLVSVTLAFLLVGCPGFPAYRVPHGLRLGRCAFRAGHQVQHVAHVGSMTCRHDAHATRALFRLEHRHRHQLTITRKNAVGMGQLKQTGRQAVAVTHGCLLDRPPGLIGTETATDHARERNQGFLAKSDLAVHVPHLTRLHLHRQFDRTNVAGLLNDFADGQYTVRMGIANRGTGNRQPAWSSLYRRRGCHQTLFQR